MKDKNKKLKEKGRDASALFFCKKIRAAAILVHNESIRKVCLAAKKQAVELYLVGGAVRNAALGKPLAPDLDFVLVGDVKIFSETVARELKGVSFLLDKETSSYRVTIKHMKMTVDFSSLRGKDIVEDLGKRDFTINAMGISADDVLRLKVPVVVDPFGGIKDSRLKLLRVVSGKAFEDDPLRCLRAVRLSQQYGLTFSRGLLGMIRSNAALLKMTSAERIRDEIIMIFASPGTKKSLKLLFSTGITGVIFPETSKWRDMKGYDLRAHSFKVVEEAESILKGMTEGDYPGIYSRLYSHFQGEAGGSVKIQTLFKLAAFFHDIGKPETMSREEGRLRFIGHDFEGSRIVKDILKGLKFSRKVSNYVYMLVRNHHRVFTLSKLKERSFRAKAHFFRSVGGERGIDLLFLALADVKATRGCTDEELTLLVKEMLDFYYGAYLKKKPRPVLSGEEIMETFGVPEGKIVGEIISKISDALETGTVRTRKEAVKYIRKWLTERCRGMIK